MNHAMIPDPNAVYVDTDGECSRAYDITDGMRCSGPVEERVSRSGLTVSHMCQAHREDLEERLDRIDRDYPDTDTPPSWFDPTIAGESWDGE